MAMTPVQDNAVKRHDIAKITFTSGTSGSPKGVCLQQNLIDEVTNSLYQRLQHLNIDLHMCLLPLSTLLENIAGLYVPLMMGRSVYLTDLKNIGFNGSSGLVLEQFVSSLAARNPDSVILFPHLLQALVAYTAQTNSRPFDPVFMAVGGSKLAPSLIGQAWQQGWPVYEGYGLSEMASVVSLNVPGQNRPGSVGKLLAHVDVAIEDDEICLCGNSYTGYLNEHNPSPGYLRTGDHGYIDDDGYLYVTGRKKDLIITSYGRNISPEWIESELQLSPYIKQCMIVGDAQPFCSAIIVQTEPDTDAAFIAQAIDELNEQLPDYARIRSWFVADEAFSPLNGLLTANGRLKRPEIAFRYQQRINAIYESQLVSGVSV